MQYRKSSADSKGVEGACRGVEGARQVWEKYVSQENGDVFWVFMDLDMVINTNDQNSPRPNVGNVQSRGKR